MAERTIKSVQDGIVKQFEKDYPEEKLWGKVFSLYLLTRYATLLYRVYEKARKDK